MQCNSFLCKVIAYFSEHVHFNKLVVLFFAQLGGTPNLRLQLDLKSSTVGTSLFNPYCIVLCSVQDGCELVLQSSRKKGRRFGQAFLIFHLV